jgi:hypothetical protein
MIPGEFEDAGELTPSEVAESYRQRLATVVETVGVERVVAETTVDEETATALADGRDDGADLSLRTATELLALEEGQPAADAIAAEARDLLLMGMSIAVLDVDAVASGLGGDLEPKEIQAKVEGRQSMTLGEYARLHQFIEANK